MKIRVINQNIHCLFFYVPPEDLTFVGQPVFHFVPTYSYVSGVILPK